MTDEQTQSPAAGQSRLQALLKKYGDQVRTETPRADAYRRFEGAAEARQQLRLGRAPTAQQQRSTGDIHAEMAEIELALAELAEKYGELNVDFKNVIGKSRIYTPTDLLKMTIATVTLQKKKRREIKIEAARRRGNSLEILTDRMGNVLEDQYQTALRGRERSIGIRTEVLAHWKTLDTRLVDRLKTGYVSDSDYAAAESEVTRFEGELSEVDGVLADYENKVQEAKGKGELDRVNQLTSEMSQVLDIKYGLLDGRLAAEGVVSDLRRKILESSEGVQSAKAAIAATRVNYQAVNALIDAYTELEFKYRHAKEDFIPVFKTQGQIAASGLQALNLKDVLLKTAAVSQRLMEANSELVKKLSTEVFDLVKTPLYDKTKAAEIEERLKEYMTQLNANKLAWAEEQRRIIEQPATPHYAVHQ